MVISFLEDSFIRFYNIVLFFFPVLANKKGTLLLHEECSLFSFHSFIYFFLRVDDTMNDLHPQTNSDFNFFNFLIFLLKF
jgi:hypothetical protein